MKLGACLLHVHMDKLNETFERESATKAPLHLLSFGPKNLVTQCELPNILKGSLEKNAEL